MAARSEADVMAAASWYREHGEWMKKRARSKVGIHNSEDLVQEAFAKTLGRGDLETINEPAAFLSRVLSNEIISEYRSPSRREMLRDTVGESLPDHSCPGEKLAGSEDVRLVREALGSLKLRQRQALILWSSGVSREALARVFEVAPHAMTELLGRAKRNLGRELIKRGYVPIALPAGLTSQLRRKLREVIQNLAQTAQRFDPTAPALAMALAISMIASPSGTSTVVRDKPLPAAASVQVFELTLGEDEPSPLHSPNSAVIQPEGTNRFPTRRSVIGVEHGQTRVGVDEGDYEKPEPTLQQQVTELINDPKRIFPSCPRAVPCP